MIITFGTWTKIMKSARIVSIEIYNEVLPQDFFDFAYDNNFVDGVRSIVSSEFHKRGNLLK